jgi:hypothetical protein
MDSKTRKYTLIKNILEIAFCISNSIFLLGIIIEKIDSFYAWINKIISSRGHDDIGKNFLGSIAGVMISGSIIGENNEIYTSKRVSEWKH